MISPLAEVGLIVDHCAGYTGVLPYRNDGEAGESYAETMRRAMNRVTCDKMRDQRRLAASDDTKRFVGERFKIGQ